MENVKLPDLDRLRGVKKRLKDLPPQESVTDTSNWENRNVAAPVLDTGNKKKVVRRLEFLRPRDERLQTLSLNQIQKMEEKLKKKLSK